MTDTIASPGAQDLHEKQYRIIINGEEHIVETEVLSYEQVVSLAYPTPPEPNMIYTVTYRKAKEPHEGSLVPGQRVEIKEGTIFDVTPTGKS